MVGFLGQVPFVPSAGQELPQARKELARDKQAVVMIDMQVPGSDRVDNDHPRRSKQEDMGQLPQFGQQEWAREHLACYYRKWSGLRRHRMPVLAMPWQIPAYSDIVDQDSPREL